MQTWTATDATGLAGRRLAEATPALLNAGALEMSIWRLVRAAVTA